MNWQHNSFYQSQVTSDKNVIIINVHWCAVICTSFNRSMDL